MDECDRWLSLFAQVNVTLVAIILAVNTFLLSYLGLEKRHFNIILDMSREVTIWPLRPIITYGDGFTAVPVLFLVAQACFGCGDLSFAEKS